MSNRRSFVILALVRKKAETLGKIEEIKEKLSRLEDDSASLDASIQMFDPEFDLSSVKPIRKRKKRKPRPNGASRRMLEVLRTSGAL